MLRVEKPPPINHRTLTLILCVVIILRSKCSIELYGSISESTDGHSRGTLLNLHGIAFDYIVYTRSHLPF